MYDRSLLITGLAFEAGKREALSRFSSACDRTVARLETWVDAYDKAHPQPSHCDGSILCQRVGLRHKDGCLGRTEPFSAYVRGLQ